MTDLSKEELRKAKEEVAKKYGFTTWKDFLLSENSIAQFLDVTDIACELALTSQRSELLKELDGTIDLIQSICNDSDGNLLGMPFTIQKIQGVINNYKKSNGQD